MKIMHFLNLAAKCKFSIELSSELSKSFQNVIKVGISSFEQLTLTNYNKTNNIIQISHSINRHFCIKM